jgi:hypothetical protein
MVTTDTWLEAGRIEGLVICGGCGAAGDLASFPYEPDLLEAAGRLRCERCDDLIVGTPVLNEWGGGPPFCSEDCREDEAERLATRPTRRASQ